MGWLAMRRFAHFFCIGFYVVQAIIALHDFFAQILANNLVSTSVCQYNCFLTRRAATNAARKTSRTELLRPT